MQWMAIALLLIAARVDAACNRVFRVPYDKPHEKQQPGYDVLEAVLQQMGCGIEKHFLEATIARHHRALAEGKLDILSEASRLPEREQYAWFSLPYREEEVLLVARRDNAAAANLPDLNAISTRRLRLIIDEHAWWGPEVKRLIPQWKRLQLSFPNAEVGGGYAELRLRRGDLLISTDASFNAVAAAYPDLHVVKHDIYRESVHFMFSRRSVSRAEVDAFDRALGLWLKTKEH